MEGRSIKIALVVILAWIIASFIESSAADGALPEHCMVVCVKECKKLGVPNTSACIRSCPAHCLPPISSNGVYYCNLGCLLDQCLKFHHDGEKMKGCTTKCREFFCDIKACRNADP